MRERGKRLLCCLAVLLLLPSAALAEPGSFLAALLQGDGLTAEMTVQILAADALSDGSLEAVNGLLTDAVFRAAIRGNSRMAEIVKGGESAFAAVTTETEDGTRCVFLPSGNAYWTEAAGPDALALLTGQADADLPVMDVLAGYPDAARAFFGALGEQKTPKRGKGVTVKNAGTADYESYEFARDALTAEVWRPALEAALPYIREALAGRPDAYAAAEKLLRGLTFSGECKFKRFLSRDGAEMGMQFSGRAALGGDARKVTFSAGFVPGTGGHLKISLPAVRGNDDFKLEINWKIAEKRGVRTWTVTGAYSRKLEGQSDAWSLEAKISCAEGDAGEAWSGKITLTQGSGSKKTSYVLTPEFTADERGLTGTASLTKKNGNKTALRADIAVYAIPGSNIPRAEEAACRDLRGVSAAEARALLLPEITPLTLGVARFMAALPEDVRALLTHEMRTDAWMNGPAVPGLDEGGT